MLCDTSTLEHDLGEDRHVVGEIQAIDPVSQRVLVSFETESDTPLVAWLTVVELAVAAPGRGDRVLCTGPTGYVIAVVERASRCADQRSHHIKLDDGARVEVSRADDWDEVRIRDEGGGVILEYLCRDGRIRINAPRGDLACTTDQGDIRFAAAGDVVLSGAQVRMNGRRGVLVTVPNLMKRTLSSLALTGRGCQVRSQHLDVQADRAAVACDETEIEGRRVSARIAAITVVSDRVKTTVECVITTATNAYQRVQELAQLCAGRTRTIVDETAHTTAKRSIHRTAEDCKILGDKIHIG